MSPLSFVSMIVNFAESSPTSYQTAPPRDKIVSNNERGTLQAGFGFVNSALGKLQGFTRFSFRFGEHMPRSAPVKAAGERSIQGTAPRVTSAATSARRICHISYGI